MKVHSASYPESPYGSISLSEREEEERKGEGRGGGGRERMNTLTSQMIDTFALSLTSLVTSTSKAFPEM